MLQSKAAWSMLQASQSSEQEGGGVVNGAVEAEAVAVTGKADGVIRSVDTIVLTDEYAPAPVMALG